MCFSSISRRFIFKLYFATSRVTAYDDTHRNNKSPNNETSQLEHVDNAEAGSEAETESAVELL